MIQNTFNQTLYKNLPKLKLKKKITKILYFLGYEIRLIWLVINGLLQANQFHISEAENLYLRF